MATQLGLPPLLPTAPPHSSSISSGSSPLVETPLSPTEPVNLPFVQHASPWFAPGPYPMANTFPPTMVPPPAGGMSAPSWAMAPPPQPYHNDPFKPYNPNEVYVQPPPSSSLGIVTGPPQSMTSAPPQIIPSGPPPGPRYPPPSMSMAAPIQVPMCYHAPPMPPAQAPMGPQIEPRRMASPPNYSVPMPQADPRHMASPPNYSVPMPQVAAAIIGPRPHPYIRNTILYINSVAPQATEQDLVQVLERHGIEYSNITLGPPVPWGERLQPNVYYNWMPKQGFIAFRTAMEVEKAHAILGCHPYFVGHLNMVISPFADMRIALPNTEIAPRIIRPTDMDLGLLLPWEGLIWDAARPWGSIKSVTLVFDKDNVRHSHDGAVSMPWKATIDFWYEEEAVAFENAVNGCGCFVNWPVTVFKDPSFITWTQTTRGQWPQAMPDAQWPIMPPMPLIPQPVAVEPPQCQAATPEEAPVAAHAEAPSAPSVEIVETVAPKASEPTVSTAAAPPVTEAGPSQGLQLAQVPPLPDHANAVSEQTPTALPQQVGQNTHPSFPTDHNGNTPPWRRWNGWRRPPPNFGAPMLPPSPPEATQSQSPWANHHKHAGGMVLPATPPWDNVPLRGNFIGRGMGYPRKKNNRFKREWRQVDGGYVSNDGSVVQGMQAVSMRQPNVRSFGPAAIDPYNLIVRGLEPDITAPFLASMFERFGRIVNTKVMRDELGSSRGFGFVQFTDPLDAAAAITAMNDTRVGPRFIKVAYHQPRFPRPQWRTSMSHLPTANVLPAEESEKSHSESSGDQVGQDDAKTSEPLAEAAVAELTEAVSSLNVDDLTMASITNMKPTAVLAMVNAPDSCVLEHLEVERDDYPIPHFLRGDKGKKIDIIRQLNKIAGGTIQDMKRSEIVNTVREYVNSLSYEEERAIIRLLPYRKLVLALALKHVD